MTLTESRNIRPKNALENVLFELPNKTKKVIRQIEKSYYKINSTELAEIFNNS